MNIDNKEEKQENLLSRKRITMDISFDGATPSNEQLIRNIAGAYEVPESNVSVKHVKTAFGMKKAFVKAFVYDSPEAKKSIEKVKEKKEE